MKLCIWMTIGGATNDAKTRRIGWQIPRDGWLGAKGLQEIIEDAISTCRAVGVQPIILLHNPWGTMSGEPMDFDQRIEALESPGLQRIRDFDVFCESWLRPRLGDDGELIIYVGSILTDQDMKARTNRAEAFLERAHRSLLQIPDWASIGLDVGGKLKETDPGYAIALLLRNCGRKVYVEPRPHVGSAVENWPIICDCQLWHRSDPDSFEDAAKLYLKSKDSEVIQFVFDRHGDVQDLVRGVRELGHVPAVEPKNIGKALN